MNEFDLIEKYFNPNKLADVKSTSSKFTQVGNGDDAAVILQGSGNAGIAVSVDTCVESVHFQKGASPYLVAKRAFRTALSDLAAIGATPRWTTLALTLPKKDARWLAQFSKGLQEDLTLFDCELIGGDTTNGPLTITFQVMGIIEKRKTLRSGARVDDGIYVTNTLGNGAASLFALQSVLNEKDDEQNALDSYAKQYFYTPDLTFEQAREINEFATSVIDISDGLVADLGHLCKSSHVGAVVQLESLPLDALCLALAKDKSQNTFFEKKPWSNTDVPPHKKLALEWALNGGDDYELCFTANVEKMNALCKKSQYTYTQIGAITQGDSVSLCYKNYLVSTGLRYGGYSHF